MDRFFFETSDQTRLCYYKNFKNSHELDVPVLVFNYGLVCSHQHWAEQILFFHQKGFPILIHDYRGHHESEGRDDISKITLTQLCFDLKELLDFLQVSEIAMLGHSMGVNLCLEFAILYPEKVKCCVLVCGTAIDPTHLMFKSYLHKLALPPLEKIVSGQPNLANKIFEKITINPIVQKLIHHQGFNTQHTPKGFIKTYTEKLASLGPSVFLQMLNEMRIQKISAQIHQVKCPCLIIAGGEDKVIPVQWQELLHQQITNSQYHLIEQGSHVPQIDFPDEVSNLILDFFRDLGS